MTELLHDTDAPSDAELISSVRGGDVAAYGELFSRHVDAANRLARQLVRGPDADDLVSEAFAKVLSVLQGGGGPDVAFRAYLLTAVRRLHVDRIRSGSRLQTTDDLTPFDAGIPFQDTAVAGFESGAAAKAFASLPERWQLVLWHLEVEGQKPADIAPLLGMSANSVSALAYRAREGLRQAFLTMHLSDISEANCRWVNEHLGAYVRNGLSKRDTGKVQSHLDECRRCTAMYLELTEVNSNLSGIIAPLLLGAAASGYLASSGGAGAAGVLGLVGRARDAVLANAGAATAGAVAAGVAAVAAVGITLAVGHGNDNVSSADHPVGTVSTAPATPGSTGPGGKASRTSDSGSATATPSGLASLPLSPSALVSAPVPVTPAFASASDVPAAATDGTTGSGTNDGTTGPGGAPSAGGSGQPTDSPSGSPSDNPSGSPSDSPSGTADPSPTPGSPGSVQADVSVSATIAGSSVTVQASGSTGLPPRLDFSLESSPGGITFADNGDCATVSATVVRCTTLSSTGGTVLARSNAALTTPKTYTATLPLAIPSDQRDTNLTLTVSLPDDGYVLTSTGVHRATLLYRAATSPVPTTPTPTTTPPPTAKPEASLIMGALAPHLVALVDGRYELHGALSGIPSELGSVSFRVSATASFVSNDGCTVASDPQLLTCPTGGRTTIEPTFVLRGTPGDVTIEALVPTGYEDRSPLATADNSSTAELAAAPAPTADVALTVPSTVAANHDGTYDVVGTVSGVPDGYDGPAKFTLDGAATFADVPGDGCAIKDRTITCALTGDGDLSFRLRAPDNTQRTDVTLTMAPLTGYADPTPNSPQPVELLPVHTEAPHVDITLALPETTHESGQDPTSDRFVLTATLGGLPAGTTAVTLVPDTAVTFTNGNGCTAAPDAVTCAVDVVDGTPTVVQPVVSYTGTSPERIALTARTPAGYVDDSPATAQTTLEPESLTALSATAVLALGENEITGNLTVTVTGAASAKPLTLTLADKNGHQSGLKLVSVPGPCTALDDYTATCPPGTTSITLPVTVPAGLDTGHLTVSDGVHTDALALFARPDTVTQPPVSPTSAASHSAQQSTGVLGKVTDRAAHAKATAPKTPAHRPAKVHPAHPSTPATALGKTVDGVRSVLDR